MCIDCVLCRVWKRTAVLLWNPVLVLLTKVPGNCRGQRPLLANERTSKDMRLFMTNHVKHAIKSTVHSLTVVTLELGDSLH